MRPESAPAVASSWLPVKFVTNVVTLRIKALSCHSRMLMLQQFPVTADPVRIILEQKILETGSGATNSALERAQ